jgi:type IV pili sensor histidine kinase/response regulator
VTRGLLIAAIATAVLSGCASSAEPASSAPQEAPAPQPSEPEYVPVVRYGRYTLVELAPTAVQRDLLLQVVDVSIPTEVNATVGDGLRHVLQRSGYVLCQPSDTGLVGLYQQPLPASHFRLGPLTLREALQTLAGTSWDLVIDEPVRQVCFSLIEAPASVAVAGRQP